MDNQSNKSTSALLITQEKHLRSNWPAFAKDLPRWRITPDPNFELIPPDRLAEILDKVDASVADMIRKDMQHLDVELLRLFRELDAEAKINQNRYRQFQITYIILALAATVIGSLQGLASGNDNWLAWFAFAETAVAIIAASVAFLSGTDAPLPRWINNRRHTEGLRQEYFRYVMHAAPYDIEDVAKRKLLLAQRAAEIHRGNYPDANPPAGGTP